MTALSALCLARLGFDPATLPPSELSARLSQIIQAVAGEALQTKIELEKSALTISAFQGLIPNPGIVREESISSPLTSTIGPASDEMFASLFPDRGE